MRLPPGAPCMDGNLRGFDVATHVFFRAFAVLLGDGRNEVQALGWLHGASLWRANPVKRNGYA